MFEHTRAVWGTLTLGEGLASGARKKYMQA